MIKYLVLVLLLAGCEDPPNTHYVDPVTNIVTNKCKRLYVLPQGERVFSFSADNHHDYVVTTPGDAPKRTFTIRAINGSDWCFQVEEQ